MKKLHEHITEVQGKQNIAHETATYRCIPHCYHYFEDVDCGVTVLLELVGRRGGDPATLQTPAA
jgi:hypothetical protein